MKRIISLIIFGFFGSAFAQDEAILLSQFLKINSSSGKEKSAALFLEKECREKGFVIRVFSDSDSSYNFAASLFPLSSGKPNIVLVNHLDIVPVDDKKEWRHPPFSGVIVKDTIWGRGALDMKGIAIMQLSAIKRFMNDSAAKNFPYNVTLLCLSGEESGGKNGAKIICDNYLAELNPVVVFGEGGAGLRNVIPGNAAQQVFFISVAEKQSVWIKLEAKVRSHAHASLPGDKNANKIILRAIDKVENNDPKIKFDRTTKRTFRKLGKLVPGFKGFILGHIYWSIFKPIRKKVLSENELLLPMVQNTFQLTSIYNPPGALNQIAGTSAAYFDCRLLPRFNEKPFTLKRLMRIIDPRITLTVLDESPEAPPTKPGKFFDHFSEALKTVNPNAEIIPFLFLASSDNSYFRNKKIPTYGIMPFELNAELMQTVHGSNERIPVKALLSGTEVYYRFLKEIAAKGN
jgi:acetylornithine deacetylase/succinyl-diaminopimelate desuccinylase-like protein